MSRLDDSIPVRDGEYHPSWHRIVVLKDAGHKASAGCVLFILYTAFRHHGRRERNDRAVRVGEDFVNHTMPSDGGEGRCAVRSQDDEVGEPRPALVKQFLSRITGYKDSFYGDYRNLQFSRNKSHQIVFSLYLVHECDQAVNLGSCVLGSDYMLQNKTGIVPGSQFRSKANNNIAGFLKAYGTENGAGGIVAVGAVNHIRAHNTDRHYRCAQHGLSH